MKTKTENKTSNFALRILKWLAIIVPVLLVVGYLGAVAADVLTTPKRDFTAANNPGKFNLVYQDVRFPARTDKLEIAGWFVPREASQKVVVLVHGKDCSRTIEFGGHFVDLAAALQQSGLNVMMIDLRGHGQSADAHYTFGLNERRDVEGAVDWLETKGFKPGSIGVLGVSLGAASSIGATADDPDIGALVEDSGFASICPILQSQWNQGSGLPDIFLSSTLLMTRVRYGSDLCSSRPMDEIGRIAPRPVLIIHSTSDVLVPESNAETLKAAAPFAESWIVTGPEHARSFNADPPVYSKKVSDFFQRSLK